MDDDLPRPKGDAASLLAKESLDAYSVDELNERIQQLESEIVRIVAHRDKARAHRVAADALFGKGGDAADGGTVTEKPPTRPGLDRR